MVRTLQKTFWFKIDKNSWRSRGCTSRLRCSDFQKLFKVIRLMTSETWMNQDYFLKLSRILVSKKKTTKCKDGKKSKEQLTVAFFVSSSGFKVCKPVVVGKSKIPRCFRKLPNPSKPFGMQYFYCRKALMRTEIMI